MNVFETRARAAEAVKTSFGATSIIFGSMIGFLFANGVEGAALSVRDAAYLSLWLFSLAMMAHLLLQFGENIVWRTPWLGHAIALGSVAIIALLFPAYQTFFRIDSKVWFAVVVAWFATILLIAVTQRYLSKDAD